MAKPLLTTKEDANRTLRVAWAIATGRIQKPYESAVKDLLDFRDALKEAGFWWQAQRVEKAFHYFVKLNSASRSLSHKKTPGGGVNGSVRCEE